MLALLCQEIGTLFSLISMTSFMGLITIALEIKILSYIYLDEL